MQMGKLIGKGMTAEVFEWGQDKILKLYFQRVSEQRIKLEAEIGYTIHEAGIASPALFDIVEIDGRKGIVFQRIFGNSMITQMAAEPWSLCHYAQQMARFHFKIHQYSADPLPSQKEKLTAAIKASKEILGNKIDRILDSLERLPDGISICHGDLHFDNIIISPHGLVAIDWANAYKGNPLGDAARTCLMAESPAIPPETSHMMAKPFRVVKRLTYWAYLNEYMRLAHVKFEDIDAWRLPVAAARIKDKIPGEEKWLMDIIHKRTGM